MDVASLPLEAAKQSKFVENVQDMIFQFLSGTMQSMNDISIEQKTGTSPIMKNDIQKGSQLSLPPINLKKKGGRCSEGSGADPKKPPPRKN
jgi:hypothetical protein